MQSGNITTNIKVKVGFAFPALSLINTVMCTCHVYDPDKGRYDNILGRYPLTEL